MKKPYITPTTYVVIRVVYKGTPMRHIVSEDEIGRFHNAKVLMKGSYNDCFNRFMYSKKERKARAKAKKG